MLKDWSSRAAATCYLGVPAAFRLGFLPPLKSWENRGWERPGNKKANEQRAGAAPEPHEGDYSRIQL